MGAYYPDSTVLWYTNSILYGKLIVYYGALLVVYHDVLIVYHDAQTGYEVTEVSVSFPDIHDPQLSMRLQRSQSHAQTSMTPS